MSPYDSEFGSLSGVSSWELITRQVRISYFWDGVYLMVVVPFMVMAVAVAVAVVGIFQTGCSI